MKKGGKKFVKPGFLQTCKINDYEMEKHRRIQENNDVLNALGLKSMKASSMTSVQPKCANGKRKRIRAEVDDQNYTPSDDETDSDSDDEIDNDDEYADDGDEYAGSLQHEMGRLGRQNARKEGATKSRPRTPVPTQTPNNLEVAATIGNGDTDEQVSNSIKKGRGVARGFEVMRRLKTGGKIQGVIFNEEDWLPVGPAEKIFKMELGVITRMLAPLRIFYWKQMTAAHKAPLFERLESEFDVKFDDQHTRDVVDAMMATRFRQFKHHCHKHYQKFSEAEAPQHPPVNVEPLDWIPLCEHFKSEKRFQDQSTANKANRNELKINHTSGSKSYRQRLYEMENPETPQVLIEEDSDMHQNPNEMKLYYHTHRKKDGTWVHQKAEENYKKMDTLSKEPMEDGGNLRTGGQILEEVLGKKSGYVRGLGLGAKPKASTASKDALLFQIRRAEEATKRAEEATKRAEEAEKRAEQFYEEVQTQRNTIAELKESHAKLDDKFEWLVARFGGTNT